MQSVDIDGLSELDGKIEEILKNNSSARRELHERLAEMIKQQVDAAIASAGFSDSGDKLRHWQESRVGSRGGYAAVRAVSGETGPNSPGAITNYNENGHRINGPRGQSKRYVPSIHTPYVNGRHFYKSARSSAQAEGGRIIQDFANELTEKLND